MWFLFGFLTISICICVEFWRRHLSRWAPENTIEGLQYKHDSYKGKVTWVSLGIVCDKHASFSLKRQSWLDNLFKRMGVSNEFETGDSSFDDLIYLVSDNKTLHYALANTIEFRSAVKNIMNFGVASQLEAREICCRNGRLWGRFKAGSDYSEGRIPIIVKALTKEFKALGHAVQQVSLISGSRWADPFVIKAAILLAVSSGLAINGAIQFFRLQFGKLPFTVDYLLIVRDALGYSILFMLVFALIAIYWLGRSARTHIVLVELMTVGAFGIFLTLATEMRDMNMEMDIAAPQTYTTQVVQKYTTKGRRSGTKYHLVVKDWNCDCGNYSFTVPDYIYFPIVEGGQMQVLQHQGHLHYPWVSQIRAL
ncbi:MAG: hypothetical protein EOO53_09620 [Gammaproteobacteria bacterium]|nr:MAG: hypothetical protein EOO53_09620 [Gammaproteobacteria bacterium]